MNCRKCGSVLMEGAKFCTTCGTPITDYAPAPAATPVATPVAPVTAYAATTAAPTAAVTPMGDISPRETALSVLKSPVVLIMGILWLVISLFLLDPVVEILDALEHLERLDGKYVLLVFIPVLLLAQTLLCGIGFIVAAVKARQNQLGGIGAIKGGFVLVLIIFSIITLFLIMGIAEVVEKYERYSSYGYGYGYEPKSFLSENAGELLLVFSVIVILFVAIAKVLTSLKVVQTAVMNNKAHNRTSVFAAVISFLVAVVFLYIMAESGIMDAEGDGATMAMIMLLSALAICILLGIMLIMFRKIGAPAPISTAASVPAYNVPASTAAPVNYGAPVNQNAYTGYGQQANNSYQQPVPDLQVSYQQPVPDLQVSYQQPVPDLNVSYQQPVPDLNVNNQQSVQNMGVNYQQPVQTASNNQQSAQAVVVEQQPVQTANVEYQQPIQQVNENNFQVAADLDADIQQSVQSPEEPIQENDSTLPMN